MIPQNVLIYHCQHCGKIAEQSPGLPAPVCCGRDMAIGAVETQSEFRPSVGDGSGGRRAENKQESGR